MRISKKRKTVKLSTFAGDITRYRKKKKNRKTEEYKWKNSYTIREFRKEPGL